MNILFVLILGISFLSFQLWMFKILTNERWQFLATIPLRKTNDGRWQGINLTYYGVFTASALAVGVILFILMMESIHQSLSLTGVVIGILLAICLPSARIVARVVEGKSHTFTIGGATFVGVISAPIIIEGVNYFATLLSNNSSIKPLLLIPTLAAISVAYSFGEGLGRLACVSFGCCYGKRLEELPNWANTLVKPISFKFSGETHKACYASKLNNVHILPIQAITSVLYVMCGLISLIAFLEGFFTFALILSLTFTQLWRLYSETLRADYRGDGKVSPYQVMTVIALLYIAIYVAIYPITQVMQPELMSGLVFLWSPEVILSIQAVWLISFFYTGTSTITSSQLKFELHEDRI
jgi:hypothetical protein